MSKIKFIPHILAELCLPRDVERRPEPNLIMDRADQVSGYLEAGDNEGGMFAVHLFHAAHMTQTIYGAKRVIDLACGPATQLLLVAQLNPDTKFVGVDLSAPMLEAAERRRRTRGIENVEFLQEDITDLNLPKLGKFDAVTSTMAAHHLPTADLLKRFIAQVQALAEHSRGMYIADLLRPKRQQTLDFMVRSSSDVQSKTFNEDFKNSLTAAFIGADFQKLQRIYLPTAKYYTTLPLRLFMILKSEDRPIPSAMRRVLAEQRSQLSARLRRDLDDLRFFFSLGGLRQDPFT